MVGTMRGTTRWIVLLLALTLVGAACGDDDDGGTFGADAGGGIEAFCDLAQQQEDLDQSVNGGEVNIFEPDEFRGAFEELADLTEQAADDLQDEGEEKGGEQERRHILRPGLQPAERRPHRNQRLLLWPGGFGV